MSLLATVLVILASFLALLGILLLVIAWRRAWGLTHPPRKALTRTPTDLGVAHEDVTFLTNDGLILSGWFIPPQNGRTLIACHGIFDNREQFLEQAVALSQEGYGFLLYDSRAHGQSSGTFCTYGQDEIKDVAAAVAYLETRPEVDMGRLGILGNSLGGITAIRAAARLPQLLVIVAESTFADFGRDIRAAFTRFTHLPAFPFAPLVIFWGTRMTKINLNTIRPVEDINAIAPRPIFLISDLADEIVDEPYDGELLYARAGAPKALWQVPECQHVQCFTTHREDYLCRVSAFLEKAFSADPAEMSVAQANAGADQKS